MNRRHRLFSVILAALMLLTCLSAALPVFAGESKAENIPILRVRGEQTVYAKGDDGKYHELYDDDEYVSKIVKKALPYVPGALMTGNWERWSEKVLEMLLPAYDGFKPDAEGNVSADSKVYSKKAPSEYEFVDSFSVNGSYQYVPDMRVSPMDEADGIKATVDRIKELTGQDKIILIGQCAGNAYMLAYLKKYEEPRDYAGIESVMFSTTTTNGQPHIDAIFSGNVDFESESAYQSLIKYGFSEGVKNAAGGEVLNLIHETLEMAYVSRLGRPLTINEVNKVYSQLKDCFIAKILKEYYGRCGGYITSVVQHYEEYKDYVFPTSEDKETYAAQIEKFDDYYYNVCLHQKDIISAIQNKGKNVFCIAEYGVQSSYPYAGEITLETSDVRVPISYSSFGATGRTIGDPFPDEYVAQRAAEGLDKYISPDRTVDGSTAFLRDTTWYIKNADHRFDAPVMDLATAILRSEDATADKLASDGWLRFMNYNGENNPLTEAHDKDYNDTTPTNPRSKTVIGAFFRWFATFFKMLAKLIFS